MRSETNAAKVRQLIDALGERSKGPGRVYLTGGATAVLVGWRETTVDVDIKLDPEPAGVFDAIAQLKDEIDMNIELASPDQFIPEVPGWRERSRHIATRGPVDFFHYDAVSQALSKIERGHDRDLLDVREMVARGLIEVSSLEQHFDAIRADLKRYPGVDAATFEKKVRQFVQDAIGS